MVLSSRDDVVNLMLYEILLIRGVEEGCHRINLYIKNVPQKTQFDGIDLLFTCIFKQVIQGGLF